MSAAQAVAAAPQVANDGNSTDARTSSGWRLELPYDDGPAELAHRGLLTDYICRQAELGRIYIKKIGVDGNVLQLERSSGSESAEGGQPQPGSGSADASGASPPDRDEQVVSESDAASGATTSSS